MASFSEIEGLDPGRIRLLGAARMLQPGSQFSGSCVTYGEALTDLDDTLVGSLVRVRAGTNDREASTSRCDGVGHSVRPPEEVPAPRRERARNPLTSIWITDTCRSPCPGVQDSRPQRPLPGRRSSVVHKTALFSRPRRSVGSGDNVDGGVVTSESGSVRPSTGPVPIGTGGGTTGGRRREGRYFVKAVWEERGSWCEARRPRSPRA